MRNLPRKPGTLDLADPTDQVLDVAATPRRRLTAAEILAADDIRRVEVEVPEWGGSVFVKGMTGSERDRFEAEHMRDPSKDFRARIAVMTVCDEHGSLLFTREQIPALGAKSGAALDRIFPVAVKLSKISKADIEELTKNL